MPEFTNIITDKLEIAAGVKVIKAADYQFFQDGEAIIESAQKKAEQILEQAQADYETEKKRGYLEGCEQAKQEQSQALLETVAACQQYVSDLSQDVAGIVLDTMKKIVGQFDDKELTLKLVDQALSMHKCHKVVFRVHPDNAEAIQQSLVKIKEEHPEILHTTIEKDSFVESPGCVLETDVGNIQAGMETQIRALVQVITEKEKNKQD